MFFLKSMEHRLLILVVLFSRRIGQVVTDRAACCAAVPNCVHTLHATTIHKKIHSASVHCIVCIACNLQLFLAFVLLSTSTYHAREWVCTHAGLYTCNETKNKPAQISIEIWSLNLSGRIFKTLQVMLHRQCFVFAVHACVLLSTLIRNCPRRQFQCANCKCNIEVGCLIVCGFSGDGGLHT